MNLPKSGRTSASAIGRQRWNHLLFAHWRVDPAMVQATLPPGLSVDTYRGGAFVGVVPFFMQRVRPVWLPPLPWISWFLELNVRTYVRDADGRPGVWFYSLDCNQPLAVGIARRFFHLPYVHARMTARIRDRTVSFSCRRRDDASPPWRYKWTPGDGTASARPGSLEFFLVERYLLYASDRMGRLFCGQVEHAPYRLNSPYVSEFSSAPAQHAGFRLEGPPVSVLGARSVDVSVFPLERVALSPA